MNIKHLCLSVGLGLLLLLSAFQSKELTSSSDFLVQEWQMTDFRFTEKSLQVLAPMDSHQRLALKRKLDRLIKATKYQFETGGKVTFTKPSIDPSQGSAQSQEGTWQLENKEYLEVKAKNGKVYRYKIVDLSAIKLVLRPEIEGNLQGDMIFAAQ